MARIEIDPNYSSPTFSRATAATDIFKKEDVQSVAAALSTHDHSSGKGVVLTAGAIPSGLITSAMIADGTIQPADLAANAATISRFTAGSTSNPTTTSSSFVDLTDTSNVWTTGGAGAVVTDVLVM